MTYTSRPIAPFKIDILSAGNPSSYTAGQKIPFTGTPKNTTALVSSGQVTIYEGSHWKIEYSAVFQGHPTTGACQFEIQLYSVTDSAYIGHSAWGTSLSYNNARKGRVVATAFLLSSEISTSKVIEARIISQSQMSEPTFNFNGKPTLRVMELPA